MFKWMADIATILRIWVACMDKQADDVQSRNEFSSISRLEGSRGRYRNKYNASHMGSTDASVRIPHGRTIVLNPHHKQTNRNILDDILPRNLLQKATAFSMAHLPYFYSTIKYRCFKSRAAENLYRLSRSSKHQLSGPFFATVKDVRPYLPKAGPLVRTKHHVLLQGPRATYFSENRTGLHVWA